MMYTIIMNDDKSLVTSVRTTIIQGESMVDKIQFLFPEYYGDINLFNSVAVLKYIDKGNIFHTEILAKDTDLYKGKVRCMLPVDSRLTQFAGDISIRVSFVSVGEGAGAQEILKTENTIITISKDDAVEYSGNIPEQIAALQTMVNENAELISALTASKGDTLSYNSENAELSLMADEEPISTVSLDKCHCDSGVPVVDLESN